MRLSGAFSRSVSAARRAACPAPTITYASFDMDLDVALVDANRIRADRFHDRRALRRTPTNIDKPLMQGTFDTTVLNESLRETRVTMRTKIVQRENFFS